MANSGKTDVSETRRGVLKAIGAASVSTLLGGTFPATASSETGDTTVLGDFESGLDGWRASETEELQRVETAQRPVAITSGTHGLAVTTNGDLRAGIENETRVRDADFVENPYLFATVTPGRVFGTDSAVAVQFRLHHTADGLLDGETSTVESAATAVRPHVASVLAWDTSSVDETKRANATRLEIVWYPDADLSTEDVLNGDSEDEWTTVFDDVHLSDDRDRYELVQMADHWERLKFANGAYRETNVLSGTGLLESGEFVFADGTAIPYTVERLSGGDVRYVIDGITYHLGGDL